MEKIINRVLKAMELTFDFYSYISAEQLRLNIHNTPSNTIGEQAWCIIGARESYLKALEKGYWVGFSCSLKDCTDKESIVNKLEESEIKLRDFLQGVDFSNLDVDILIDLLEHEVQHHGQLIRFSYSNKIGFPKSWNARYTV